MVKNKHKERQAYLHVAWEHWLVLTGILMLLTACSSAQASTPTAEAVSPMAMLEKSQAKDSNFEAQPLKNMEAAATQFSGPLATTPSAPPLPLYLPLVSMWPQLATRMGMGDAGGQPSDYAEFLTFKAGWYLNWTTALEPDRANGMEFAQMIRLHQDITCPIGSASAHNRTLCPYVTPHSYSYSPDAATIAQIAQANPNSLWLIGNEIERRDWPGGGHQDEILPELYAVAYNEIYGLIKAADPTAQVAIGGVIQATPLRMKYLERVLTHYEQTYGGKMPVDIWNIHAFILPEMANKWGAGIPVGLEETTGAYVFHTDANGNLLSIMPEHIQTNLIDEQIRNFRQWMKDRGEQEKPLIITEYSVLLPNWVLGLADDDYQSIVDFMNWSFDYFLNTQDCAIGFTADDCRLVQRWVWYSMDDTVGFNEHQALFDPVTRQIKEAGKAFRQFIQDNLQALNKRPY
jgi:hypothetical protein